MAVNQYEYKGAHIIKYWKYCKPNREKIKMSFILRKSILQWKKVCTFTD